MRMKTGIVAVVCLTSVAFGQGSLTPPGAPGETMKTLQQVEPRIDLATVPNYQITQSGSYYLSDNLVISNSIGISIGASDVTLDLNGFKIQHAGGQGGKAIYVSATRNVTIKNGSINEFEDGVYMYGSDGLYPTQGARLENLNISRCTGYGLFVGSFSKVINCHFSEVRGAAAVFAAANSSIQNCTTDNSSGGYGFQLLNGARVSNCSAINSGTDGFNAGSNSVFNACTASENKGGGFEMDNECSLSDCTARNNAHYGIHTELDSTVSGCTANGNGYDGIKAFKGCTISGCVASDNRGSGISAGSGSTVTDCAAHRNDDNGINVFIGGSIFSCTAYRNGVDGIVAAAESVVFNCSSSENTGNGISITEGSIVKNCVAARNGKKSGGAGIRAANSRNRIEGNNITINDLGIRVGSSGNFVTCNTATGNTTNYDIVSSNNVGTIQTTPVGAGAWDNFSF